MKIIDALGLIITLGPTINNENIMFPKQTIKFKNVACILPCTTQV
jgi:hypothetical protein